jgi:hypothetical protein
VGDVPHIIPHIRKYFLSSRFAAHFVGLSGTAWDIAEKHLAADQPQEWQSGFFRIEKEALRKTLVQFLTTLREAA